MTRQGAARRSIKTTYQLNFYQTLLVLSSGFVFQDFPQKVFLLQCFIERMGVFYATTIGLWASLTTPAPYVSCIGQAACRDFDTGNAMGSGTA